MTTATPGPVPQETPTIGPIVIRAREPGDLPAIATLMQMPKVRFGTLRLPWRSEDEITRRLAASDESVTSLVAVLSGAVVGSAALVRAGGRRSHVASLAIAVHDDFQGRGIGTALLAALIDTADNWLNLKRLELSVYTDNAAAIRLYRKFGFADEGIHRADAFRDGAFVDSLSMGRVR